jgi:hypothetical protein
MIRRMALKPLHEKGFDKALLREMMVVPAMPMTGLDPAKYPEDLIVACVYRGYAPPSRSSSKASTVYT